MLPSMALNLKELNQAQQEAVLHMDGPLLVLAGAGSGKTRTIIHRLAHFIDNGIPAHSILLLTFTKKVAHEMLHRASVLLEQPLLITQGGTFHSFAYTLLRQYHPYIKQGRSVTVMDSSDSVYAIQHAKNTASIGKQEKSFPKTQTILSYISKARNKEDSIENILRKEAYHLLQYTESIETLASLYKKYKEEHALLDYDDLLFVLEDVLQEDTKLLHSLQDKYRYIMVDEYQDTNPIQARIVQKIAGEEPNLMVVGDDAQSIYAFRGADIRNIMDFPSIYPNTKIVKLEQNYRSTQAILDVTNSILEAAPYAYQKKLFSAKDTGIKPVLVKTKSDISQAESAVSIIADLLTKYPAHEIAVLFRAGYQSYSLEMQLNKMAIPFKKFGGGLYSEAAHIKDVIAFLRLMTNPSDMPAFTRIAGFCKGIGEKTALKIHTALTQNDIKTIEKLFTKYPDFSKLYSFITYLRESESSRSPVETLRLIFEEYQPILEMLYPDDWVRRIHGLEQIEQIASVYRDIDVFLSDISLHEIKEEEGHSDAIILSTIHSAKGLEWSAVIIIDLVEERFPSKQSLLKSDDFEEERRLMYVACTRAKEELYLFAPSNIYHRDKGLSLPVEISPFIKDIPYELYSEQKESYRGFFTQHVPDTREKLSREDISSHTTPYSQNTAHSSAATYCYHKQFGRGKIVQHIEPDKYKIDFPRLGIKTIMGNYLSFDE
ncbi:MAG: ATP-dependent helicase [Desulfovibrionaceae bacterium]